MRFWGLEMLWEALKIHIEELVVYLQPDTLESTFLAMFSATVLDS